MDALTIQWILNGCGMEAGSITGGPVRFHEISRRWAGDATRPAQRLMTTAGGEGMLRRMGCTLPMTRVPAALVADREWFRLQRFWSYCLTALCSRRATRRLPPCDAVITVSDYFCDIVPACRIRRLQPGSRWIAWIHHRELPPDQRPGNRIVNHITWRMQEWSLRRIAAQADAAWLYETEAGDQVRERLLALGMPASRIRTMRCGINLEAIRTAPEGGKDVDAAMIGVRPNKGLHDILPVWEALQRRRPGTTLRLMGGMSGEGPLLEAIGRRGWQGLIEACRPPRGFLPQADYYAMIKRARVLFAPSHEEGWGMAVAEAMAAGVPVAAYDLPVYRRIYGQAFEAVPCFDTDGFARRLAALLDDPTRAARIREAGFRQAQALDWNTLAAEDLAAVRRFDFAPRGGL